MKDEKGGQMKELDFDELHDAVNKLMEQAQKPKSKREPAKSAAKAVSRPSVKVAERPAPDDKPKEEPKKELPKPEPAKTDEDASPITVRRQPRAVVMPKKRGMAMDVVQTAKPAAAAPPSARAARTGVTLQPTGPVAPEPPSPRAATPAPAPQPSGDDVSDEMLASLNMHADGMAHPPTSSAPQQSADAMPDPLDVHGFKDEPKDEPTHNSMPEAPQKSDADMPDPLDAHQSMQHTAAPIGPIAHDEHADEPDAAPEPRKNQWELPGDDEPAEQPTPDEPEEAPAPTAVTEAPSMAPAADATPFVHAKIEKRPLGAYATAAAPSAPTPTPVISAPTPAPEPAPAPKPEPQAKAEVATVNVPETPELNPELVAVESQEPEFTPSTPAAEESPLQNLRQMSIPQQYPAHEEKPSKDDRPVFDTKDYHTPLQPVATAKKHTGSKAGLVLTLILILLIVAAGIVAYFVATGAIDVKSFKIF